MIHHPPFPAVQFGLASWLMASVPYVRMKCWLSQGFGPSVITVLVSDTEKSKWHVSVGAFYSLAIYLSLKCKKIIQVLFFKKLILPFPLPLSLPLYPYLLSVPFSVPFPLPLISLHPYQDIIVFDAWALSEYTRDSEDRQTPKVLWIVVAILLMIFDCSLSALEKFESILWPLCLGSQC